jgi:sarcosine oxidase subunit alpha
VRGPHAAEFLHRIYVNNVHSLRPGRVRYGLMLNENGVIIDDGVFCRLADEHFLVNTTSGGAARILAMFEEWLQCEWTDLQVLVDDVTAQWAISRFRRGPRTAAVGRPSISRYALPHMAAGELDELAVRVLRVSFSGECSFEVNLPAMPTRFWPGTGDWASLAPCLTASKP